MSTNAMADCVLPEEIVVSILTRLPVQSIFRCKSVCKPWLELLSSPNFRNLHHGQFSSDPRNDSFIAHRINKNLSNTLSVFKIGPNETKPTILDHPFSYAHIDMDLIGCCNGLVCLSISTPRTVIHLWNPALKLSKEISPLEECGLDEMTSLGFGYDAEGDDFKVVRIVGLHTRLRGVGMNVNVVEVYSSNSDSWIRIKVDFLFGVIRTTSSVNVNGNPYWIARVGEDVFDENRVLVCFDVTKLVFKIFPLSTLFDVYNDDEEFDIKLFDFNGCLGALMFGTYEGVVEYVHVWVLDDGEEIWRMIRSLEGIEVNVLSILQWTKNEKIIGQRRDNKLFVFDPESRRVKLMFNGGGQPLEPLLISRYTESLAYVKAMKKVKARKRTRKRKMIDG